MNEQTKDFTAYSPKELALEAVKAIREKLGTELRLYHVEETTVLTDYYVIATGRSTTHIKALADQVAFRLGEGGVPPHHEEGREGGTWLLLDFSSVIVHIFSKADREYYNLERLLPEGTEVDISAFLEALDRDEPIGED